MRLRRKKKWKRGGWWEEADVMRVKGEETQTQTPNESSREPINDSRLSLARHFGHKLHKSSAAEKTPQKNTEQKELCSFLSLKTVVGSTKMTGGSTPQDETTRCITTVGQNVNMFNILW